ncbi:MAG: hydroxyacid dehydrogenase [Candidatus Staskawiczbacteria bacterium]|nr:hydroxyacid dehydrogenase [Candidatus Staskawiczbacteria bacterium]
MKIAFFEIEDWEKEYLHNQLKDLDVSFYAESLSLQNVELALGCDIISVFINSQIDKSLVDKLDNVKMIATRSTGFDHIDVSACQKNNIAVSNVPFYGENTVAEHTFALILDLSRKIYQSVMQVKQEGFGVAGLMGFDLKDKTLGVIGMGHIGQHVTRIAQGFEMKVLAFDLFENEVLAKKLGFTYASLDQVLQQSDIITLHLPYNKETHHLINSKNINLIKTGAYVINTARGGLIETSALVDALGKGIIAGAGLDVLEEECNIKEETSILSKDFSETCNIKTMLQNHILMDRKNVIITPHNAFNSKEAIERILQTTVENIKGFGEGNAINIV